MLTVIEKYQDRLINLAYHNNRRAIIQEITRFCQEVDAWLTEGAREKAEIARQLTEYFQGMREMNREEPRQLNLSQKERNVC